MSYVQEVIAELEKVNLENEGSQSVIQEIISTKLQKLPIFLNDLKTGEPVVRARFMVDPDNLPTSIQDFSFNPNRDNIRLGRANFAGQQVFYASRFRITSFAEVRFVYANREKEKTSYAISRWEPTTKLNLAAIVTPELIRKHNSTELFGLADYIEQIEQKHKNDPEMSGFLDIYRYMSQKYTEAIQEGEEYKYKITAVFSNFIYSKLPIADGILYQSVQYPQNFNIALRKEVVEQAKIKMTFCAKQDFIRTGGLNYKEVNSIQATEINHEKNSVIW